MIDLSNASGYLRTRYYVALSDQVRPYVEATQCGVSWSNLQFCLWR